MRRQNPGCSLRGRSDIGLTGSESATIQADFRPNSLEPSSPAGALANTIAVHFARVRARRESLSNKIALTRRSDRKSLASKANALGLARADERKRPDQEYAGQSTPIESGRLSEDPVQCSRDPSNDRAMSRRMFRLPELRSASGMALGTRRFPRLLCS